jgi:hypothetical protein
MYTGIPLKKGAAVQSSSTLPSKFRIKLGIKHGSTNNRSRKGVTPRLARWNNTTGTPASPDADYDAKSIDSIIPSFGMLANSHTGLVNLRNDGCRLIEKGGDGSQTVYRDQPFTMLASVEAGHELFADYGDHWFTEREDT